MFQTCSVDFEPCDSLVSDTSKSDLESYIRESIFLRKLLPYKPKIGIICDSELGFLAEDLAEISELSYSSIPNIQKCTVGGHEDKLILGKICNVPVLIAHQNLHLYEGQALWECTLPIRIFRSVGIEVLITTNAVRAINKLYKKGDVMIIKDHIDLARLLGNFSLRGHEDNLFDFPYNPVNRIYDKKLIEIGLEIGKEVLSEKRVHTGIHTFSTGPNRESRADMNFLKRFGSDVVGSSSVHEAIVAKSCGMTVFGFSLITSLCNMDYEEDDEEEHQHEDPGNEIRDELKKFLSRIVQEISKSELFF